MDGIHRKRFVYMSNTPKAVFGYILLGLGSMLTLASLATIGGPGVDPPGPFALLFIPGFVFIFIGLMFLEMI